MNRSSSPDLAPALDRFVTGLPILRHVLALPATSGEDRQIRASMRRTALELAAAFEEAARLQPGTRRAAEFRAAAIAAADLAAVGAMQQGAGH